MDQFATALEHPLRTYTSLSFRQPSLWFFQYHTFCIWNKILMF